MTANMRQRTDIGIMTGRKRRRPGLERGLTVTAACFILLSTAPLVSIAKLATNSRLCNGPDCAAAGVGGSNDRSQEVPNVSKHGDNGNVCLTAVCNDTATMILKNMDSSVGPCDNFYRHVCGGYLNLTDIHGDLPPDHSFSRAQSKLTEQLITIVEAEIEPNEPRAYRLVKKYYKSCMNESAIAARGVQPLLATLRRIGGWPTIDGASWNESNFDWTEAIYELRKSGHHDRYFINVTVTVNELIPTEYAIHISPPNGVQFDDFVTNDDYHELLRPVFPYNLDVATSLGAQNNTGTEEEIKETLIFRSKLKNIPKSEITINNTATTPMTLAELKRNYPYIPWQEYIRKMMSSTVTVPTNEVMIVEKPIYFTRLDKLLSNTSKRVLANYIALTTALESTPYIIRKKFEKVEEFPKTKSSFRQQLCIERVSSLYFAIESMYLSRHFSADAKSNADSIMDDVRKGVRQMLETNSWLDQITKSRVLQKLDAMFAYIAYADRPSNDELDKIYENLELDEENYYENSQKVLLFNVEYSLGKLRQPVDKRNLFGDFKITQLTARYFPEKNSLRISTGILQDVIFGEDRPRFMNYGAIGTIMGHEIIHAFQGIGKQYNEKGEVVSWWQPSSEEQFSKRAQCIVDQYSNYPVPEIGLHVNGTMTLDENMADNGGIKGAYIAYSNWVAKNGEEPKLPGIDMTPYQLFWISTATLWCTALSPNDLRWNVYHDEHSLPEFRVIGPMSNIPEFANDFKCLVGSNMNPSKKCRVW